MSKFGGYRIVDFNDVNITTEPVKIDGIYDKIKGTRKVLLLSGVVLNGTEKHDCFVQVNVTDSNYTVTIYNGTLTITQDDMVSFTAN